MILETYNTDFDHTGPCVNYVYDRSPASGNSTVEPYL